MGKVKKGFNWKARQNEDEYQKQTPAEVSNTFAHIKVRLDIDVQQDKYDESNTFALPSKKQKAKKIKQASIPQQKPLSKKRKKELEKVLKKRIVGQSRKQLYEDLAKVQASDKELSLMTSVSEAQTIGVKRLASNNIKGVSASKIAKTKINSIKGSVKLGAKKRKGAIVTSVKEPSSPSPLGSENEENNEFTSVTDTSNDVLEKISSDLSGLISNDASSTDHSVETLKSPVEIESIENGSNIVEAEMDGDVNECKKNGGENNVMVGSLKKKKIKIKSTAQLNQSKEETEMEKQSKTKETEGEMDVNVNECKKNGDVSNVIVGSLRKKKIKRKCSAQLNQSKEETEMEKQSKKKETKGKMDVDVNECQKNDDESNVIVGSLRKKKIKRKSTAQLNQSKEETEMEKQSKKEGTKGEMDVDVNECKKNNDDESNVIVGSLRKKKIKRKCTAELNQSKEEKEMEKQSKKEETKGEMDVELDECQKKCHESNTMIGSLKKKKIKRKSLAQLDVSKQEVKTEKQSKEEETKMDVELDECHESNTMISSLKKKKIKRKSLAQLDVSKQEVKIEKQSKEEETKKNQIIKNLEEESTKEELDATMLPSKDKKEENKRFESSPQTPNVPAKHIPVLRTEKTEKARSALPILSEEHTIMNAIHKNSVVVIYGETGCGKTTQIPQFLYEAGYASEKSRIGITEPRRLAAITMSQRVAHEMNLSCSEVSYRIRYEGNVTPQTKIKFMTDGVLLKEIKDDFYMTKYSAIIIDEAHERTMQSDVLIGLLSRVVKLREKRGKPLKLIIMSATLRLEDFVKNKRLFDPPPPVVTIDARQHPVTILYNRHTVEDYIGEAYRKVCKIHRTNQYGGILVFVTGQEEVNALCRKLKQAFPVAPLHKKRKGLKGGQTENENQEAEEEEQLETTLKRMKRSRQKDRFQDLPNINLDDYCAEVDDDDKEKLSEESDNSYIDSEDENEDLLLEGNGYIDSDNDEIPTNIAMTAEPLYVLPLYSMLPADQQAKVFQPPPAGRRLCVIATNVAETSLTVPNIKYIVDTGKVKRRMYDKVTGVSTFVVTWISKASAKQRTGRAGRTSAGYCYRLYSSAVYENDFPDFFEPEIIQRPVDDIVLQLKFMRIDRVVDFPFPRSPDVESIKAAEERLVLLGALEKHHSDLKKHEWASIITPFGETMASISVSPRYSKMIALSNQKGVMPYTIATVAALTVQEIFIDGTAHNEEQMEQLSKIQKQWKALRMSWAAEGHSRGLGDVMALLEAVGLVENGGCIPSVCHSLGVRYKAMMEIRKLRKQLTNEVSLLEPELKLCVDPNMKAPTELQKKFLRQILLSGMADHVARKVPEHAIKEEDKKKLKNAYECLEIEEPVFIHPSSVLFKQLPEFVMYQEIIETSKHYMKIVSAIEPSWLPVIGRLHCTFSDPLDDPPPRYDSKKDEILCHMKSTYGWRKWQLEPVEVKYPRNDLTCITWFAQFFLEGEVCTSLKAYSTQLLSKPAIIAKPWARVIPRAKNFLNAFIEYRIYCKKVLQEVWDKDPKYLLKEYCEWTPESLLHEITEKWPPL